MKPKVVRILEFVTLLGLFVSTGAHSQARCFLDTAKDGEKIKVRGQVFPSMIMRPSACSENIIDLEYGDSANLGAKRLSVNRDEEFKRFEKYLLEEAPLPPNTICAVCLPRYEVTADLEGRLDVAPFVGDVRDETGRIIRVEGFGNPKPVTRYRLVITSVSNVVAKELPSQEFDPVFQLRLPSK